MASCEYIFSNNPKQFLPPSVIPATIVQCIPRCASSSAWESMNQISEKNPSKSDNSYHELVKDDLQQLFLGN